MKKNIWIFGLLSGLVIAGFMIFSSVQCYNNPEWQDMGMVLGYTGMLLAFSFVFVGIKNYRDKFNGGFISFGEAFKIGGLIALIASTMYVVVWLFEFYIFMPDFMDSYMKHFVAQLKRDGTSQAEINKQLADMGWYRDAYKTPFGVIALTYMEVLPVALVMTLLSALILKRKPKDPQPIMA
jgi:hypothetical protein